MKNAVLLIADGDEDGNPKIGVLCSKSEKNLDDKLETIKSDFEDSLSKIVEVEYKGEVTSSKLEAMLKRICRSQIDYVVPKEDKKKEDDDDEEKKITLIGNVDDEFYEKLDEEFEKLSL